MVVNKTGNFLSQRNTPRLALIKQQYKDGRITLSAPGKQDISFSIEVPTRRVDCRYNYHKPMPHPILNHAMTSQFKFI